VNRPVSGVDSKDSNQNGVITVFGELESIELTPTSPSDTVGEERFFTATGHCWWALLLGYLGGHFATFVYLRRSREPTVKSQA